MKSYESITREMDCASTSGCVKKKKLLVSFVQFVLNIIISFKRRQGTGLDECYFEDDGFSFHMEGVVVVW
jgi:hypothetical protein